MVLFILLGDLFAKNTGKNGSMHIQQPKQIKYSKMLHNGCNFSGYNHYFFQSFF